MVYQTKWPLMYFSGLHENRKIGKWYCHLQKHTHRVPCFIHCCSEIRTSFSDSVRWLFIHIYSVAWFLLFDIIIRFQSVNLQKRLPLESLYPADFIGVYAHTTVSSVFLILLIIFRIVRAIDSTCLLCHYIQLSYFGI